MLQRPLTVLVCLLALGTSGAAEEDHARSGEASDYTLLEVMQHLASSQQQIQVGILMNNRLMIQKGAAAIAHHPLPKGGIKPYIKKNQAALEGTIKEMDQRVHATAVTIFEQSQTAAMLELQALNERMVTGCVHCHDAFRD